MAPQVLEAILYQVTHEIAQLEGDVVTSEDWVDETTTKFVGSYMDDISVACEQYSLDKSKPAVVDVEDDKKFDCIKDSLMERVIDWLKNRGLCCKSKKLQLLTSASESQTLGIQFNDAGETMSYSKLKNLKEPLPDTITYKSALAYLATLTPCLSELAPPWALVTKNALQQAVGLNVALEHEKRGVKCNNVSKSVRSEIWTSPVPSELDILVRSFQTRFTSDENQQWSVLRGLDLNKDLEVFVDSSNDVVGYWLTQNGRKLFYQQGVISKLGTSFVHINVKEVLGVCFALIDITSRFVNSRVKMPKIRIFTDSKTALSTFRNLRVNVTSGDLIQRSALSKLLNSLLCILTPEFLRNQVSYDFVPGIDNVSDSLTRDELYTKVVKYVDSLENRKKPLSQIPEAAVEMDPTPAECFVLRFVDAIVKEVTFVAPSPNNVMVLGGLSTRTKSDDIDLRGVYLNPPKLPPAIFNFYTLKIVFDKWKSCRGSEKLTNELVKNVVTENCVSGSLSKISITLQFLHDQRLSFSDCKKADADNVYRETFNVKQMEPLPLLLLPSTRPELTHYIVCSTHRLNGHCKFLTLLNLVNRHFHGSLVRSTCKKVCRDCYECAVSTRLKPLARPVEEIGEIPVGPGRKISIDVFGPIDNHDEISMDIKSGVSSAPPPRYFLTVVDCYSKRRYVYPLLNFSTVAVRIGLLTNFQTEGFPSLILCDSASVFKALEPWANSVGCEMEFTQVYCGILWAQPWSH
jgi:hypothetical protein